MARRSSRLPASWATEINVQSRYPAGTLPPKIGAPSPSDWPDAGATYGTAPADATIAASTKTIRRISSSVPRARAIAPECYSTPTAAARTEGWIGVRFLSEARAELAPDKPVYHVD